MQRVFAVLVLLSAMAYGVVALAQAGATPAIPSTCVASRTTDIRLTYGTKIAASVKDAKDRYDKFYQEMQTFIKTLPQAHFEMKSNNYTISARGGREYEEPQISLNSSVAYTIDNEEAALKFGEFLTSKNIQFELNSRSEINECSKK